MNERIIDQVQLGDLIEYEWYDEFIDDDGYTHETYFDSVGEVVEIEDNRPGRLRAKRRIKVVDIYFGGEKNITSESTVKGILSRKQVYEGGEDITWFGEILREALERRKENPRDV